MAWFSPFTRELVDLTPEEIEPEPATRLVGIDPAKTRDSITRGLASSRERLAALEAERQRIDVEAANTRLAISALEAAEKIMTDGDPDFAAIDLVDLPLPEGTTAVVIDTMSKHVGGRS